MKSTRTSFLCRWSPVRLALAVIVLFATDCAWAATAQLPLPQLPAQAPTIPSLPNLPTQAPTVPSLPNLPLQVPAIPPLPDFTSMPSTITGRVESALDVRNLLGLRQQTIRELLRQHRDVIEADPAGEPIVRSEIVALSSSPGALKAARAAGFTVASERALDGIDGRIVVLRAPAGLATAAALQRLRALDPQGIYDYNHIYFDTGDVQAVAAGAQRPAMHPPLGAARPQAAQARIGLIDGGLDLRHPALRNADIRIFGCAPGPIPSVHGTAVASLLVGRGQGFAGAAPAAVLYAADVYCGHPTGGAVAVFAEALAWMAREQVPVINISLVGPANRILERAVGALIAQQRIVVAAVGNDGPAAPPLYPAAYENVIGVTAVDMQQRVLPEAARGPHVSFAAPGADMAVAKSGGRGFSRVRGTSFASPLVAGLLAVELSKTTGAMDPSASRRTIIDALIRSARDLGAPGRDTTYGFGLVGEQLHIDPVALP